MHYERKELYVTKLMSLLRKCNDENVMGERARVKNGGGGGLGYEF